MYLFRRILPLLLCLLACGDPGVAGDRQTSVAQPDAPLFTRHVQGVFSRLGCNGGTCHGAVQGQNGFRLSLFSADPALDYAEVVRDGAGRRVNPLNTADSLLLLKPAGEVPHAGGRLAPPGTVEYEILRRWIEAGAPFDAVEQSRVVTLNATPSQSTTAPGAEISLRVEAEFADGSREDVTALCSFLSRDEGVATVDADGRVRTVGAGDTTILVRYRAQPTMVSVIVPRPAEKPFPEVAAANFIDEHILNKLRRLNIPPAATVDDATFLRRTTLDVAGRLPTPREVRDFLADDAADKRAKKVDILLNDPGYAALWALKFCDLLGAGDFGVYADGLAEHYDAPRFHAWVRARLDENVPYDEFAARILTATSREGRSLEEWGEEVVSLQSGYATPRSDLDVYSRRKTLDLYWQRKGSAGVSGTLQVAHSFLGLRLGCAQCHRHPHDVWLQDDLLSFANFFMQVRQPGFRGDNEKKFPEAAALFKKFKEESKKLAEAAKQLKADKGDQEEIRRLEKRSKLLGDSVAKRVLHAETRHLPDAKAEAAVTSPLGTQNSQEFRLLGETEGMEIPPGEDPRKVVAEWMRRPDNPFFAKAIVNRVWAHYFGRGIVDPPDNLSPLNPPSHPELLDELCRRFIANKFDLKWLHRVILTSRTYQQSGNSSAENRMDRSNYAFFYYRRLPAEVLMDALNQATGSTENMDMKYYHWPEDLRTVEIPYRPRNTFVNFMLDQFGRPQRNSAVQCDCERDTSPSVLQVMTFASHPHIRQKIVDPGGSVFRINKDIADVEKRIEELFMITLSRPPTDYESKACREYIAAAESAEKALPDLMWSLLNTREFQLQH